MGALDATLQGGSRSVAFWQLHQQPVPVVDGLLEVLVLEGRDTQQAQTGDLVRVGLERLVGQRLQLFVPLFAVGEVQRLGPLPEQFGLTFGQGGGTLEDLGGIGWPLLGHVGPTEEVQAFG
ncbi:hypothetical protein D3C77_648650 [compost metagenome]